MESKEFCICLIAIDKEKNKEVMQLAEHGFALFTKEISRKEVCTLLEKAYSAVEGDNGIQAN